MKIVIDLQSLQGNNRNRGIGRYSLALSQALLQNASQHHEIYLCLNCNDIETIEEIRSNFNTLIPDNKIRVFEIPKKEIHKTYNNSRELKIAEKIRENFIANLNPDLVYISSVFERGKEDTPISIGEFNRYLNAATLYDLIPFIFSENYINDCDTRNHLFQKMQFLKKNDLILTISDSAASEAKNILGIPRQSVINCSVGIDSKFKKIDVPHEDQKKIKEYYGIRKEFIFYLGGLDFRKNVNGLLAAYAILPYNIRKDFQLLIIVSDVTDSVIPYHKEFTQRYNLNPEELILLNHISENTLIKLYNICSLFIFPSLHEGFGLPILEAMACGAPTITSNTSSMPEAAGCKEALFNPRDRHSIANKIHEVLTNKSINNFLKEHAIKQVRKFTWEKTAKKMLTAFEDLCKANKNIKKINFNNSYYKKKMAFVSPLPPDQTGIADYSAQLLPDLAFFYEITLITNQKSVDDDWLNANFIIQDDEWFVKHASSFEVIVYQFGNSHYHYFMLRLLNLYPGIVVLHDFYLSGLYHWADVVIEKEQYIFYRAIHFSHGFPASIECKNKDRHFIIDNYPCNLAVLKRALGIIVLSQHTIDLAYNWYGPSIVSKFSLVNAPHLSKEISTLNRKKIRAKLGLKENDFIICTFGFIGETKQCHRSIFACSDSKLSNVNFHLVFVGGTGDEEYNQLLFSLIKKNKLEKKVKFVGFATLEIFKDYLFSADIAIQLRTKSRGETSACILNCLSYGIPTIVNAHGSIQEIAEDVVIKLKDQFLDSELSDAIYNLYKNIKLRNYLSKKALNYIEEKHHPVKTSKEYNLAIEYFYSFNNIGFRERYLIQEISSESSYLLDKKNLLNISSVIAANRLPLSYPQLLIDISSVNLNNEHSSSFINLLKNLLTFSVNGFRVEAVYYNNILNRYCYATSLATNILNLENKLFGDMPIDVFSQDIFLIASSIYEEIHINCYLKKQHAKGSKIFYLISNKSSLLKHGITEQDKLTFQSNLNKVVKFNQGYICIDNDAFNLFITCVNKYLISHNKIFKVAKISSTDHNTTIEKLKELFFYDKWDIKGRYENVDNLNATFSRDSFTEVV